MNVGDLRKLMIQLDSTDISDDSEVLISGPHSLHTCSADVMPIREINSLGQTQTRSAHEHEGPLALVFSDTSQG
jgi:hypothetical protein